MKMQDKDEEGCAEEMMGRKKEIGTKNAKKQSK
jgi:hypothetical protein